MKKLKKNKIKKEDEKIINKNKSHNLGKSFGQCFALP